MVLLGDLGARITSFRQSMSGNSDNIQARASLICRQLVQSEPSQLTGRGLDAAACGCCAWLQGFAGAEPALDAAARKMLGNIWDEGLRRAATIVDIPGRESFHVSDTDSTVCFPNTESLYAVLALYRIAYGPTVPASDYSLAEQCDALASSLLEHAAGRHSALDGREDDTILMHVAANLYCYVVPEDLEDDDIVESLRTIAGRWKEDRSAPVDLLLQRLCALEAANGLFGEWRPALPPASAVASPEGLSALVRILARRLDDPAALAEACAALERQLSLSPDLSAAASLLEGLGALRMLTEEGAVLNCA